MNYINPPEIASRIMTLMDEAEDRVVIISPYNKVGGWKKLEKHLRRLQDRRIRVEWYVREGVKNNDIDAIAGYGIEAVEIKNLHAKVYFNEKNAIVTSMNLHQYSDSNSLDFGYMTETQEEYEQVLRFYRLYIQTVGTPPDSLPHAESDPPLSTLIERVFNYVTDKAGIDGSGDLVYRFRDGFTCHRFFDGDLALILSDIGTYFTIEFRYISSEFDYDERGRLQFCIQQAGPSIVKELNFADHPGTTLKRLLFAVNDVETGIERVGTEEDYQRVIEHLERCIEVVGPRTIKCMEKARGNRIPSNLPYVKMTDWVSGEPDAK